MIYKIALVLVPRTNTDFSGAMTYVLSTFSWMAFFLTIFSITTFSIATFHIIVIYVKCHNYVNYACWLSLCWVSTVLNVIMLGFNYAECCYAQCHLPWLSQLSQLHWMLLCLLSFSIMTLSMATFSINDWFGQSA